MSGARIHPMTWVALAVFIVGIVEFIAGRTTAGVEGVLLGIVGLSFFEWVRRSRIRAAQVNAADAGPEAGSPARRRRRR